MSRFTLRTSVGLLAGLALIAAACSSAGGDTGTGNTRWADPVAGATALPARSESAPAVPSATPANARSSPTPADSSGEASASNSTGGVPNETAAPPAHLRGNTDLAGMIPDAVNGHPLQKSHASGADLVSSGGISDEFQQMLDKVGRTATDITMAMGDDSGQGGSFVAVFALRVDGVAAATVLKHYMPIVTGGSDRVQTMDRAIAGKPASCVNVAGDPMWSCYVPRDDVLFIATSDEFLLINKAILAIP